MYPFVDGIILQRMFIYGWYYIVPITICNNNFALWKNYINPLDKRWQCSNHTIKYSIIQCWNIQYSHEPSNGMYFIYIFSVNLQHV